MRFQPTNWFMVQRHWSWVLSLLATFNIIPCTKASPNSSSDSYGPPKRIKNNIRSTKTIISTNSPRKVIIIPQPNKISNKLFTNQAGCFPHRLIKGNQYVLVAYVYEANTILARPLKIAPVQHSLKHSKSYTMNLKILGSNPNCTYWTMRHPRTSRMSS